MNTTQQQQSELTCLITPKAFDFRQCLVYLNRSDQERLHFVGEDSVTRLIKIDGNAILFQLNSNANQKIRITYLNQKPSLACQKKVREFVSEWFDLEFDLPQFYAAVGQDPLIGPLTRKYFGLRVVRIHDLFQALCWAIIGQQVNIKFTYTLYRRFIENFGESLHFQRRHYWIFPEPETVATLPVASLRRLQFTGKKSEYIVNLAGLIASGELSKENLLAGNDFESARQLLLKIRGVGPWTANYVLLRCLCDRRAFPVEDVGLHQALQQQLNWKRKPTINEVQKMATAWSGCEAYAAFYLYRSLI